MKPAKRKVKDVVKERMQSRNKRVLADLRELYTESEIEDLLQDKPITSSLSKGGDGE